MIGSRGTFRYTESDGAARDPDASKNSWGTSPWFWRVAMIGCRSVTPDRAAKLTVGSQAAGASKPRAGGCVRELAGRGSRVPAHPPCQAETWPCSERFAPSERLGRRPARPCSPVTLRRRIATRFRGGDRRAMESSARRAVRAAFNSYEGELVIARSSSRSLFGLDAGRARRAYARTARSTISPSVTCASAACLRKMAGTVGVEVDARSFARVHG